MKFSIAVAALISACSAIVIPQQPLPAKFSLTFKFNSGLTAKKPDIMIDESFPSRLLMGDQSNIYGTAEIPVFNLDGDNNILMNGSSFGADTSGYILLYNSDTLRDWRFPIQLGTFAQVNGNFAFNAGDGHGPPTTQWVACLDERTGIYNLAWNRDDCTSVEIKVVPL